jgi:predicted tellurium resistance membrane protein TerC/CBS domain-containing protein
MEWMMEPTAWVGFLTLVLLEIVLGIDNLIFIAILANKLPPSQQDRARQIGLGFALFMRIGLLLGISKLVALTKPWLEIWEWKFSGRDIIMFLGGLFLICKATLELHERIEGTNHDMVKPKVHSAFWGIVAQIVVLDAVFSIDSVITAVGMSDHISVMITAVAIAILIMIFASKALTIFINAHPTLIVLCLGFLLMIGCTLIADGVGFHIPKGYLYFAIGFSVLIESLNLLTRFKRKKSLSGRARLRARTAEAVHRLLGGKANLNSEELVAIANKSVENSAFNAQERDMALKVLSLAERPAKSIVTSYDKLHTINIEESEANLKAKLKKTPYSRLIVMKEGVNMPKGVISKKDILNKIIKGTKLSIKTLVQQAIIINGNKPILDILEKFKETGIQMAFVTDEHKKFIGIITLTDIMESIAGDIPEEHEVEANS